MKKEVTELMVWQRIAGVLLALVLLEYWLWQHDHAVQYQKIRAIDDKARVLGSAIEGFKRDNWRETVPTVRACYEALQIELNNVIEAEEYEAQRHAN